MEPVMTSTATPMPEWQGFFATAFEPLPLVVILRGQSPRDAVAAAHEAWAAGSGWSKSPWKAKRDRPRSMLSSGPPPMACPSARAPSPHQHASRRPPTRSRGSPSHPASTTTPCWPRTGSGCRSCRASQPRPRPARRCASGSPPSRRSPRRTSDRAGCVSCPGRSPSFEWSPPPASPLTPPLSSCGQEPSASE